VIVILADARNAGYCSRGLRPFFLRHGLNWLSFIQSGIEAEKLTNIRDPMVKKVIAIAEERTRGR
jgi:hypothetical protein